MIKEIIELACEGSGVDFSLAQLRAERGVLLDGASTVIFERKTARAEQIRGVGSGLAPIVMPISTKAVIPNSSTVRLGPGYFRV